LIAGHSVENRCWQGSCDAAARHVAVPPSVEIVAVDLNQPMVGFAASKSGPERLGFRHAEASPRRNQIGRSSW
jgi:hypothetical protein